MTAASAEADATRHPDLVGRVAIIAGGLSPERDVSLSSGARLLHELHLVGVDAAVYDADDALLERLAADQITVAYPTIHGETGEDGALQSALELAGVPFVGSSSRSCRLAWEKAIARVLVARAGISVPRWEALPIASFRELGSKRLMRALVDKLGLPLVVKPSKGGSVLGCSGVTDYDQMASALVHCFAYGDTALLEEYVEGLDVSVGVVELDGQVQALPPVALRYEKTYQFDFGARYSADYISIEAPAVLAPEIAEELRAAAVLAHQQLGLRDISRSDFLVRPDGYVHLETAIAPGLTETSLLPFAILAAGETVGGLATKLLAQAAARGG